MPDSLNKNIYSTKNDKSNFYNMLAIYKSQNSIFEINDENGEQTLYDNPCGDDNNCCHPGNFCEWDCSDWVDLCCCCGMGKLFNCC